MTFYNVPFKDAIHKTLEKDLLEKRQYGVTSKEFSFVLFHMLIFVIIANIVKEKWRTKAQKRFFSFMIIVMLISASTAWVMYCLGRILC